MADQIQRIGIDVATGLFGELDEMLDDIAHQIFLPLVHYHASL